MKSFLLLAILSMVLCVSVSASAAILYVDRSVSSSGDGTSLETALKTIQEGIDKALEGDTVVVAEGTYVENIQFNGKNIVLTSTDRLDPTVVANTIIDGNHAGSVVTFLGTENETCVLSGFTIRHGETDRGGGIRGGTGSHGTIQNNTISGNVAYDRGGGLHGYGGLIQNNTITRNAAGVGGGVAHCGGVIQNNAITRNSGGVAGGGLYYCAGTIQNNTIAGNWAETGGGLGYCGGTIQNNTITGNLAGEYGGGLESCKPATISNCILWANTAPTGPQLWDSSLPAYSCIEGWPGGETGNISGDPRFAGPDAGDFRLLPSSPCIDAGYNDPSLPATDIAGMHRIMFGGKSLTVDMGAYEFHIWPPTENVEMGEMTLKWSSLAGKAYSVYASSDMFTWDVLADDVASAGDTLTTWIDPLAPVLPPGVRMRFYRIAENPSVTPPGQ